MRSRLPTPAVRGLAIAVLLTGAVLAGCHEDASITDIRHRPPSTATDTMAPTATLIPAPAGGIEVGESLTAGFVDDVKLSRAVLLLLDTARTVLWRSDTVALDSTADTVAFPIRALPATFPYGQSIRFTVWAEDAAGKTRYAGAPDSATKRLDLATLQPVTIDEGHTLTLATDSHIGAAVYNPLRQEIYFTDTPNNRIGALSITRAAFLPWWIYVGSQPTQLAFHPWAWGASSIGTLVAFNSGGTDVSVVDLTTTGGGQERDQRSIQPLLTAFVGSDSVRLSTDVTSLLLQCPAVDAAGACTAAPTLYVGTPPLGGTNATVTRSLSLTTPNALSGFDILTPAYNATLTGDIAVTVTARVTDRVTGRDSTLFTRTNVSRCGTLLFGATKLAQSARPTGPLFIAETGTDLGACSSGGRVLRFDRAGTSYTVSSAAILNADWDPTLRSINGLGVNDDASLVAVYTSKNLFITDSTLRRLATIPKDGITSVAFLAGQTGGPSTGTYVAVSAPDGLTVYETGHFTAIAHFPVKSTIGSDLRFVPVDAQGNVMLIGTTTDRAGFLLVPTTRSTLAVRAMAQRTPGH